MRLVSYAILSIAVLVCDAAFADDALPAAVAIAFQRAQIPTGAIGLIVQRVGAGDRLSTIDSQAPPVTSRRIDAPVVLSLNAGRAMNPASTMKLVTTYAALEALGPAFTWKTVLATSARLDGDALTGDLILRGAGDPRFVVENLWLMLRQLRGRGVRVIDGDLVLDRSAFEDLPHDPAAFDNEPFRPYNVGPDALLLNFKAITLRFIPDDTKRTVRVVGEPALADFTIDSVAYGDGPCGDWRAKAMPDFARTDGIAFAGTYAGSCGEQTWSVSVLDHRRFIDAVFRNLWSELGGTLHGLVRDGPTPADAHVLVEHESPGLAEVIRDINKYSNNVMARELFLSFGAESSHMQGSTDRAQRALRGFYASRNIALPELVVDNGSGLSRSERISAASMTAILEAAWASPLMPEFIASLPIVGLDGTMKKRLNLYPVAGRAHIKTGTLADVRAAAGYVLAASGQTYVVVIFVNHANASGAQAGQDALLRWVYDNG